VGEWLARRGGGWTRVARRRAGQTGDDDVLAVHVYRRTVTAPPAWRTAGAPRTFELDVAIHGWRGKAIDRALHAYASDSAGGAPRTIALDDGTALAAGGAAQIVAGVRPQPPMEPERLDLARPPPTP